MTKIVHPLLAMIASATDRELARYVEFLKEENRILRARVPGKQVHTTPHERERLLKLGTSLGRAVEELITIVSPSTFYRWVREETGKSRTRNPKGGQRKPREIRELVLQIARATGFGYTRIIGELRKLGIKKIVAKFNEHGMRTNASPKASPNLNGRCERVIQTIKHECLRKFIIFGKRHLDHLLSEFVEYYNTTRSSMVRNHLPPIREEPEEVESLSPEQVEVKSYVGGLVTGFARRAAQRHDSRHTAVSRAA